MVILYFYEMINETCESSTLSPHLLEEPAQIATAVRDKAGMELQEGEEGDEREAIGDDGPPILDVRVAAEFLPPHGRAGVVVDVVEVAAARQHLGPLPEVAGPLLRPL